MGHESPSQSPAGHSTSDKKRIPSSPPLPLHQTHWSGWAASASHLTPFFFPVLHHSFVLMVSLVFFVPMSTSSESKQLRPFVIAATYIQHSSNNSQIRKLSEWLQLRAHKVSTSVMSDDVSNRALQANRQNTRPPV